MVKVKDDQKNVYKVVEKKCSLYKQKIVNKSKKSSGLRSFKINTIINIEYAEIKQDNRQN